MRVGPRTILLVGWLVFGLYSYPGYLLSDGADQLMDSRVGVYLDWHSPMMTAVCGLVGRAVAGPAGLLVLQSGLLLIGAYHLLRRVMSDRSAAIAAAGVLLFPAVLATTAVISAESLLASTLVATNGLLSSDHPRVRLAGLGLAIVACGLHDGAALATVPIVISLFRWEPPPRRLTIAAAAAIAVVIGAKAIDILLVDGRTQRNEIALAMVDVVGTLRYAGTLDDRQLDAVLAGVTLASSTNIQARARDLYGKDRFYAASEQRLFEPPQTEAERSSLLASRWRIARAHPAAYLKHRGHLLYRVVGLPPSRPWAPVYTEFVASFPRDSQALQHAAAHSAVQAALIQRVASLSQTFWFRPYFYAILAIVLLPVALARRQRDASILLASGIGYEISLMFSTIRPEHRDSHWLIVATVLALVVLIAAARRTRSRR